MKRRMFAASLALAVLAVLGLADPVAAGEQVPFKGSLEGEAVSVVNVPPLRHVLVEGTGEATQLGKFTFAFPHTVHLPTRIAVGTYHIMAATGTTAGSFKGTISSPGR